MFEVFGIADLRSLIVTMLNHIDIVLGRSERQGHEERSKVYEQAHLKVK